MDKTLVNADLWGQIMSSLGWSAIWGKEMPADRGRISRDSLVKLSELIAGLTGEDDQRYLEHMVFGAHRSYRYVEARINSLYAFGYLAVSSIEFPLASLSGAIDGIVPRCDRSHAIDHSLPGAYEAAKPLLEAVMGVLALNSYTAESEYLNRTDNGAVEAKPELSALVRNHPDKASLVAPLLYKRGYTINDMEKAGDILCDTPSPLMEGAL